MVLFFLFFHCKSLFDFSKVQFIKANHFKTRNSVWKWYLKLMTIDQNCTCATFYVVKIATHGCKNAKFIMFPWVPMSKHIIKRFLDSCRLIPYMSDVRWQVLVTCFGSKTSKLLHKIHQIKFHAISGNFAMVRQNGL